MAATADRQTTILGTGAMRSRRGDVAAATIIYFGTLLARNAAGNVVPASDAAGLKVIGVSQQYVDNSAGAAGAKTVDYVTAVTAELDNAGGAIVQAGKHVACYAADDLSVTTAAVAVHDVMVGIVASFTATKVYVYIDEVLELGVLDPLDGSDADTIADGDVSPASLAGGLGVDIPIAIPDHATQTLSYKTTSKIEIIGVTVLKDGASAASTIQVTDGADAAISDAIAAAVDKAVTKAATLDVAKRILAAGATFKIVATRAAGTMAALVIIHAIKRA